MTGCGRCGTALAATARFCPACGQPAGDLVGRDVAGRYRIVEKLGEGGMGAVYRGEQLSLKRPVAVKVLRGELSANPALLARFNAEAEAIAKLGHPNTVNIYDFGQDSDGSLFIAMEFIEGRSLRSVLAREGPLPVGRALAIAVQVAASLADAHAHGIIHRDLKPDNVMLQDRGRERDIARVLDFGIAKLRDDSRGTQAAMTQAGDMLGTPQYMAPEQINGAAIDGRTDVYALGCMVYEMVTGRMPFEAQTIMSLLSKHLTEAVTPPTARRPDLRLPLEIDPLVLAAMAKDPGARPITMEQYGEQLAAMLAALPEADRWVRTTGARTAGRSVPPPVSTGAPTMATGYSPTPPLQGQRVEVGARAARKSRSAMVAGIAAIVLVGSGVTLWATQQRSKPATETEMATVPPTPTPAPTPTPTPTPTPAANDPWATKANDPWAPKAPVTTQLGTTVEVTQGVKVIVPPNMTYTQQPDSITMTGPDNLVFIVGAIDNASNDPQALALDYANKTGLKLDVVTSQQVNGVARPVAAFEGEVRGVYVAHVVAVFLSPTYRIAAIFQFPVAKKDDPATKELVDGFVTARLILP